MRKIPKATARRLPLYHRYLRVFKNMGKTRVSSTELSEAVKVESATIRRDFSYFGALGKRGYGYDIDALLNYNFKKSNNIRIGAAFDINQDIIGTVHNGVPVYDMKDLTEQLKLMDIEVVILSVPEAVAQDMIPSLEQAGIKGILNFTPVRLDVPDSIRVQDVDFTNELQTLIYFISTNS